MRYFLLFVVTTLFAESTIRHWFTFYYSWPTLYTFQHHHYHQYRLIQRNMAFSLVLEPKIRSSISHLTSAKWNKIEITTQQVGGANFRTGLDHHGDAGIKQQTTDPPTRQPSIPSHSFTTYRLIRTRRVWLCACVLNVSENAIKHNGLLGT